MSVLFTVVLSHISLSHGRGSVHIGQLEGRSISSVVRGCSGPYPSGWWFPEVREALLSLRGLLRAGDHLWVGSVRWPSQQSSGPPSLSLLWPHQTLNESQDFLSPFSLASPCRSENASGEL